MKTYVGQRLDTGCEVYVVDDGKTYPLPPRDNIRNHSPDGFEWGYGGSGPAQLALAILADCNGMDTAPHVCPYCQSKMNGWKCTASLLGHGDGECGYDGLGSDLDAWRTVLTHYQDFKADFVSHFPHRGFTLQEPTIDLWLSHREDPERAA